MNTRLALYGWVERYGLDPQTRQRLFELAGFEREPANLLPHFLRGLALVAGGLAGLGLVFWVAANWESFGRLGRSLILQALLLTSGAGAVLFARARAGLVFLMVLTVGGLLAVFGQTYQTGADTWQLFALWTGLALPLAYAAHRDAVWALWVVVAQTALWLYGGTMRGDDIPLALATALPIWTAAMLTAAGLSGRLRQVTGAGVVSARLALGGAALYPLLDGCIDVIMQQSLVIYCLALLLFVGLAFVYGRRGAVDLFGLSISVFAFDLLLLAGFSRWMLTFAGWRWQYDLLLTGLFAAALLAVSVTWLMAHHRMEREYHHA